MIMTPNRDPDEYLTQVFQKRDELEHIGETLTEARIVGIILEGPSDEYEPIRFAADQNPEISLKEFEITMRNMYANRVARGGSSTFSREKGHQSAVTASSGFREAVITAVNLATNRPSVSNFYASLAGDQYLRSVREKSVCAVCITPIFTTTSTAAPSSNSVAMVTAVATTVAITTVATPTDAVTATALTRAEPTRQS